MRLLYLFILTVFLSHNSSANDKLFMEGNTLYYNTDLALDETNAEINWDDADLIHSILLKNSNITTIYLNSSGGLIEASRYIADIVIDFELDSYVSGECSSACVDIFLAGQRRVLARGSWLGFHKRSRAASDIERYYEENKKGEGWKDAFEFSSWLY